MKVTIVGEEPELVANVRRCLFEDGYQVQQSTLAEAQNGRAQDLLLLDLSQPSGWRVLEGLRARGDRVPVVAVVRTDGQIAECLERGADDVVPRDFHPTELRSRVRAVLRRAQDQPPPGVQKVVFDERGRVLLDGAPADLTRLEYDLLAVLVGQPGREFGREELLRLVWGGTHPDTRRVDLLVSKLRRKGFPIDSVWGVGYRYR